MSNPASNRQLHVEGVAYYTDNFVLRPIIDWLATVKGIQVSVQDLRNVLELPATRAIPTASTAPVQVHSVEGAGEPLKVPAKPKAKAASVMSDTKPTDGRHCTYQYKRNVNSGKYCNKTITSGVGEFCTTHAKKNGSPSTKPAKVAPGLNTGIIPPPAMSSTVKPVVAAVNDGPELKVRKYPVAYRKEEDPPKFISNVGDLVICSDEDGSYYTTAAWVRHTYDEITKVETGVERPLTAEDIECARRFGVRVPGDEEEY